MNLQHLSNNRLYQEWTDAMESFTQDPQNGYAKRREAECLDEIIRRMKEASQGPLVRQEV